MKLLDISTSALQKMAKILLTGYGGVNEYDFLIMRYNADGIVMIHRLAITAR